MSDQIFPQKPVVAGTGQAQAAVKVIDTGRLFIPSVCKKSSDLDIAQRRLLLISEPGDGKTFTSLMTSPNPQLIDIDKGITDPRLIKLEFPTYNIWDDKWCNEVLKKSVKCNAVMEVVMQYGPKLAPNQTLILDSISSLEDDLRDYMWEMTPVSRKTGQKEGFDFWEKMLEYWIKLFTQMSKLKCHIIVTAHLGERRDKENGVLLGYGALIDGKMKQQIGRFFTDVLKQVSVTKVIDAQGRKKTEYKWQAMPDEYFKTKCRSIVTNQFIPADFNNLLKLGIDPTAKSEI
jgi:hypothetical protein